LELFVGYLCLVYHEGRNVRHLIKAGYLEVSPYERLRQLPNNREKAWEAIQGLRAQASSTGSVVRACRVFERRFDIALEPLAKLYEDEQWSDAPYGGNQWARITRTLIELRDALNREDSEQAIVLLERIPLMSHNNGEVGKKLRRLDALLDVPAIQAQTIPVPGVESRTESEAAHSDTPRSRSPNT
jgi:hypothetical protein